jgi:FkbM family methyltransferase
VNLTYDKLKQPVSPPNLGLLNQLFSEDSIGKRYIVGRNETTIQLIKTMPFDGVVDDFYSESTWNGLSVVGISQLPLGSIVVNCSTSISPMSVHRRIEDQSIASVIGYFELYQFDSTRFPAPTFVSESQEDFQANQDKWEVLLEELNDAESKQILKQTLSYRLSSDYRHLDGHTVRLKDQYFEEFMQYDKEVFVDAGGFTGDTSEEFAARCPNFEHIYLFEPSQTNLEQAKQRLSSLIPSNKIDFFDIGLSNKQEILSFDPEAGSASTVSTSGTTKIKVDRLDHLLAKKVTLIKMDLEGWERFALEGASDHIKKDHPKLAIAVYHHPSDFWKLKEFVFSVRKDYKIFLRHYTEGWSETIMFFLPESA